MPHRFLRDYDWSLYIDNTVRLKVPPRQIFSEFLSNAPSPYVCFRHPERHCVYDEAQAVLELGFDDRERVTSQMQLYRRLGYPPQNGLAKALFILRRHHDPALTPVMEHWHQQVLCHSKRDQLSLNPVMWFDKFEPTYLNLDFNNFDLLEWPVAKTRLPRDFDDTRYLELYPKVRGDPRQHYLLNGCSEGRRYK
jgi:hypothetical protein